LVLRGIVEDVAHLLADALDVLAVLDDVGHLEDAEDVRDRAHDRGGQRELHLAELELLQQLLVVAELRRAEDLDFRLVAELLVGAARELLGRGLEQRARLADVTELEHRLGLCAGGGQRHHRKAGKICCSSHRTVPPGCRSRWAAGHSAACGVAFSSLLPDSRSIAAWTPPARCGTPASSRPISTPPSVPTS